jgi:two-component system chemotaxis family response regulator WspR
MDADRRLGQPTGLGPATVYRTMVLLVDDQALIGEAVRRALASEPDIVLHYCDTPGEAVALAERIKATVILQDLVMPDMDGLELVRLYRANPNTQDVPIIVLSTKEEPAVKSDAFASGANDYLVKLPDAVELVARIRHHSRAYLNQLQRDEAYRALHESQRRLLEINTELERLTNLDGLTGLSNRRYFDKFVGTQWKLAVREMNPISVLMVDVDDFKKYNDTHGHLAGDEVLKSVGAALQQSFLRPMDLCARFGGEEFVVVMPSTPLSAVQPLGENLIKRVEALSILHEASTVAGHVTVSVGGASAVPTRAESFHGLLHVADEALYEAKRSGKNRIVVRAGEASARAATD